MARKYRFRVRNGGISNTKRILNYIQQQPFKQISLEKIVDDLAIDKTSACHIITDQIDKGILRKTMVGKKSIIAINHFQ